jgi:hypothetical protein
MYLCMFIRINHRLLGHRGTTYREMAAEAAWTSDLDLDPDVWLVSFLFPS